MVISTNNLRIWMHSLKQFLLTALMLVGSSQVGAMDLVLAGVYDTNPLNGESTRQFENSMELTLAGNRELSASLHRRLALTGAITLDQKQRYESMSKLVLSSGLDYRWQPKLGYVQPWYVARLQGQYLGVSNDHRNRMSLIASGQRAARLTDQLLHYVDFSWRQSFGDEAVFDQGFGQINYGIDYNIRNGWFLYSRLTLGAGQTWGSVLDDTARSGSHLAMGRAHHSPNESGYDASFTDSGLADDVGGDWTTYRFDANLAAIEFGFNKAVSNAMSLDVAWQHNTLLFDGGNYQKHVLAFTFMTLI